MTVPTWKADLTAGTSLPSKSNELSCQGIPRLDVIATLRGKDLPIEKTTLMGKPSYKRLQHCMHAH